MSELRVPIAGAGRNRPALLFAVIGLACVVAGGLVAAVTAHAPTQHASWAAAYLVLVAGVAQVGLGAGVAALAPQPPTPRVWAASLLGWNAGNAAVIAGTVGEVVALVDVGGVLLVLALVLMIWTVRGAATGRRWLLWGFRVLVVVLLVSIPIGLVLAQLSS